MRNYLEFINENLVELVPSDLSSIEPFDSVFHKKEHEIIARNILVILDRTGDKFRRISWSEYKEERLKDGEFTEGEKKYFDAVIDYCSNPEKVKRFSKSWNIKGHTEMDAYFRC